MDVSAWSCEELARRAKKRCDAIDLLVDQLERFVHFGDGSTPIGEFVQKMAEISNAITEKQEELSTIAMEMDKRGVEYDKVAVSEALDYIY